MSNPLSVIQLGQGHFPDQTLKQDWHHYILIPVNVQPTFQWPN